MSELERHKGDETFQQKLDRLRMTIDLLPEPHRPHLYELADTIAVQHRRIQNRKPRNHASD